MSSLSRDNRHVSLREGVEPSDPEPSERVLEDDQERLTEHDRTIYWEDLVTIPGFGKSGPGCGEWRVTGVCSECGEPDMGQHVCGRRSCPDCWGSWAKETAMSVTARIQSFRETQPNDYHRQTGHFVYSPEEIPKTRRELLALRTEAKEIALEKGVRGGVTVGHSRRLDERTKKEYREENPDTGKWVWLREKYPDSWKDRTAIGPHVHIIGLMSPDMEPGEEGDVWELIDHGAGDSKTLTPYYGPGHRESHRDVFGTVRYLLSHAITPSESCEQSFNSVTWFGELHGSKFSPEEEIDSGDYSRLQRAIEEVANGVMEDESAREYWEEKQSAEVGDCPLEECEGKLIDVMKTDEYIRQANPPPDISERLRTAYDWRMGNISPPSGLKFPQSAEEAHKAFEAML